MAAIKADWRTAHLLPVDRAMLEYTEKLTLRPAEVRPADLDTLRAHGLSDRAIHDLVQVIGYFSYINRIADGLGVDLEPDMAPDPRDIDLDPNLDLDHESGARAQ